MQVRAIAAILAALSCVPAHAEPTAEQIKQLGTTLTPWGAEIAGNKDGSIPAYTGGLTKPPAGFDPASGRWVDPYAADKPILQINAANLAQYAEILSEGQKALLERYPETMRLDIYPTRRSYPAMSKEMADAAIKNAGNRECKTVAEGVGIRGCEGATPFPLPSNGFELMWNHQLRQRPPFTILRAQNLVFDSSGVMQTPQVYQGWSEVPYWDPKSKAYTDEGQYYWRVRSTTLEPARDSGLTQTVWYPLRIDTEDQRAWSYTTGQRRVRLAPEFAYDTPVLTLGGVLFYDETGGGYAGRMDRFDFKIVGKREMFVPYNAFNVVFTPPEKLVSKRHVNPDVMRWERHRVWVVEATLKSGQRHAKSKRRYFVDEDSWGLIGSEGYDQAGKLVTVTFTHMAPNYSGEGGGMLDFLSASQNYDMTRGTFAIIGNFGFKNGTYRSVPRTQDLINELNPQAMARTGVR
jgi:hypothetical protein